MRKFLMTAIALLVIVNCRGAIAQDNQSQEDWIVHLNPQRAADVDPRVAQLPACSRELWLDRYKEFPANNPCAVHWRYVLNHSNWSRDTIVGNECDGMMMFENPQPPGHPATLAECNAQWRKNARELEQQLGFKLGTGDGSMSQEQINRYHAFWGK